MTVIIAIIVSVCVYLYFKRSNTKPHKRDSLTILDVIETKNIAKETNNEKGKN